MHAGAARPDSLTWRYFGDHRMALLGPRAAVLQNMLPALGQGVEDHSVWFAETLARLERSIPPIYNTVYGAEPETSGHEVRDFHRTIKGRLPDGSPYSALNPETYYWAHACFVEHLITATDTFIRRLSRAEKEQIFAESVTWFERYGVSSRGTPQTYAEFEAYFERTLAERARRAPHGVVRRRLRQEGLAATEAGPAGGVVAGPPAGERDQLLDHDRRDAAAGPRDPRPALGREARTPLAALRRAPAAPWPPSTTASPPAGGCTPSRSAPSPGRIAPAELM